MKHVDGRESAGLTSTSHFDCVHVHQLAGLQTSWQPGASVILCKHTAFSLMAARHGGVFRLQVPD